LLLFSAPGARGIQSLGRLGRQSAKGLVSSLAARANPENSGDDRAARSSGEFGDASGHAQGNSRRSNGERLAYTPLVDPEAKFKIRFRSRVPTGKEQRSDFDMFEADLTHEGDRCTFEVLAAEV
jgi:hypothetical protein